MWDLLISPIVGAIGGIVTQWIGLETHKVDLADKDRQRTHEREMSALQHAQAVSITKLEQDGAARHLVLEGDIAAVQADLANLGKEIDRTPTWTGIQAGDSTSMRWWKTIIESLQMLVRVVVTLWLTWQISDLAARGVRALEESHIKFEAADSTALYLLVIRGLVELAGLSVGFWFGSRGAQLRLPVTK